MMIFDMIYLNKLLASFSEITYNLLLILNKENKDYSLSPHTQGRIPNCRRASSFLLSFKAYLN